MIIELSQDPGVEAFWLVKNPYVAGEHVRFEPHPVCCGIGMVRYVYRGFEGLDRMLNAVEQRAFGKLCKANLMMTSNVEEEKSFKGVLEKIGWKKLWEGPNPIHENRGMTIWVKDNPDPQGSERYFKEHYDLMDGVVRPK